MKSRWLWVILAVGLILRASLLLAGWRQERLFFTPDSRDYDSLARAMIDRGEFSQTGDGRAELFRTPGYPLFLAGVYALTGKSVRSAVAVQILLDVLLCFLVFRLGERLCSRRVGLFAAGVQAVSPVAVVACVRLLSGGLFALLLTAAVLLLVNHLRYRRLRPALLGGILMGLACLVRPIGLPAIAITAAVLLWRVRYWRPAVVFAVAAVAVVAPWMIRNRIRAGYGQLSGVADYNLFYCNALALLEDRPQLPLNQAQRELKALPQRSPETWPDAKTLNDPEFLARCRREGLAVIAKAPLAYAGVHLRTTLNVFLPAATDVLEVLGITAGGKGTLGVLRRQGLRAGVRRYFGGRMWPLWLCAPMVIVTGLKFLAAAVGALRHVRWRMGPALWLILLMVVFFAAVPGPVAHARFRVPIAPLLSLAAGAGIDWVYRKRRQSSRLPCR